MKKQWLSMMLCLCLSMTVLPTVSFAASTDIEAQIRAQIPNVTYTIAQGSDENEDPLANGHDTGEDEETAQRYASGTAQKTDCYSKYTQKTYSVPSGYEVSNGIDVSYWNGSHSESKKMIDWKAVAADGISFAFVRIGYRSGGQGDLYADVDGSYNMREAIAAGISTGAYVLSQALTTEEAIQEAKFAIDSVKGYNITLPIVMDYEYTSTTSRLSTAKLTAAQKTANVRAFCMTVEAAGYTPMVYTNKSFFETALNDAEIDSFTTRWLSHYTTNTAYAGNYDYWQYASTGSVSGVSTGVDVDFRFTAHNWTSKVTKEANCAENGVKTYTCTQCGKTYTESIAKLAHTWNSGTVTKEASCAENGVRTYTCTQCGATYTESIAKLAHTWDSGTVTTKPTVLQNGTMTYTCTACGDTKTEDIAKLTNSFSDVADSDYSATPIAWAVSKGITNGTSSTTFSPDKVCTRGQIVTFLWRAMNSPEPTGASNPFTDISADGYYYKAVLWAVENGITTGTSDSTFSPDASCTRAQAATFLWRAENEPNSGSGNPFSDVSADAWYGKAVLWAVDNGITNGTSSTTFSPEDTCKRSQIVTFLYRDMA